MKHGLDKAITEPSGAIEFLRQTFYDAHLNLNPDMGFLKPNNKSAFALISDEMAQHAQARLVECERILGRDLGIDLWEICMEFAIFKSHLDFARQMLGSCAMLNQEWIDVLLNYHSKELDCRAHNTLEERADQRMTRRTSHMFNTIMKAHSLHPALRDTTTHIELGAQEALLICETLLPTNWDKILKESIESVDGSVAGKFSSSIEDIPSVATEVLDDAIMNGSGFDWDDDPTKGMEW